MIIETRTTVITYSDGSYPLPNEQPGNDQVNGGHVRHEQHHILNYLEGGYESGPRKQTMM